VSSNLGYRVYRDHIKVLSRNVQRAYKRLEQMEAGTFDGDARSSIASWIGYTKHAIATVSTARSPNDTHSSGSHSTRSR